MVSRTDDRIDFQKLETEVHAAVDADSRYWRENDAKFRAVNQKVATYDEFRDIVKASHLKPIDKEDRLDNIKFIQPWNQLADKTKTATTTTGKANSESNKAWRVPSSGADFARSWRWLAAADRYPYLLWVGGARLAAVFRAEISLGVLGELVTALDQGYRSEDCGAVVSVLQALTSAGRFTLSRDFLSKAEREASVSVCERVCGDLETQSQAEDNSDCTETPPDAAQTSAPSVEDLAALLAQARDVRQKFTGAS